MLLDDKITNNNTVKSPNKNFSKLAFWVLILIVLANFGVMMVQMCKSYRVFFSQKWNYYEILYIYLTIHITANNISLHLRCHDPDKPIE